MANIASPNTCAKGLIVVSVRFRHGGGLPFRVRNTTDETTSGYHKGKAKSRGPSR
jgi:hypothetical protein